ncbi:MAG: hypothetical protein AAF634_06670 [Bacteroidota bacterium]
MKYLSRTFVTCLVFTSLHVMSQQRFSPGYFIDNTGKKTDCLIKDKGWLKTPEVFIYKLSETDGESELNITNTVEVGVGTTLIFKRAVVEADLNDDITSNGKAVLQEQKIFLRILVDGEKASLSEYSTSGNKYFFYEIKGAKELTQLIRKKFYTDNRNIQTNFKFRTQLLQFAYCDEMPLESYDNLKYKESSLINFFEAYNRCTGGASETYKYRAKGKGLNLKLNVGSSFLTYALDQPTSNRADVDLEFDPSIKLGLELEYYFNLNRNKWSIVLDASYERFRESSSPTPEDNDSAKIPDFSSFNLGFGVRHHVYFNQNNKLFFNLLFYNQLIEDVRVDFGQRIDIDVPDYSGIMLGLGFTHKRVQIEIGYLVSQVSFEVVPFWDTNLNGFVVDVNYRIFGK